MNSTLTLNSPIASTTAVSANTAAPKPAVSLGRTLAGKWDMLAVIGLMVSSAVYGVYAVTQMTGF